MKAFADQKEKEFLNKLSKQTKDSDKALELQREQYEYWLNKKTEDLKKLLGEFETYKTERTAQINTLEHHALHLFDYCNALATIMANFDQGLYPVYEKTGIKAVRFPDKGRPAPMDPATLRDNGFKCLIVSPHSIRIDEGPHVVVLVQWITDAQLTIGTFDGVHDLVVDARVDDEPSG